MSRTFCWWCSLGAALTVALGSLAAAEPTAPGRFVGQPDCPPIVVPIPCPPMGAPFTPLPTAPGQAPISPSSPASPTSPTDPAAPTSPTAPTSPATPAPASDAAAASDSALAAASPAGGEGGGSFAPNMIGDFSGYSAACVIPRQLLRGSSPVRFVLLQDLLDPVVPPAPPSPPLPPPQPPVVPPPGTNTPGVPLPGTGTPGVPATPTPRGRVVRPSVRCPIPSRAAFKIADNESPRPQNRVFINYNYFNDVNGSVNGSRFPSIDSHRETFGFERTFLEGDASFGMRLPVFQTLGEGGLSQRDFGDISLVFKYAMYNDRRTGDVLSTGLVVTVPTGPSLVTIDGEIDSFLLQPYFGFIYRADRFFMQGFSSLVVPTDSRDVTILFNDVAAGYQLYRGEEGLITGLTPALELHVNTPLNNRGALAEPIGMADSVVVTTGLHVGLFGRADLTMATAVPLTGPRPYALEALAQINWRF